MKLLKLLNRFLLITLIGLMVSCHQLYWKHEKTILQENNNFIYIPDNFKVVSDSECVFISDFHTLYKYDLRNGKLLDFMVIDSVGFRQLLTTKIKYLPKRDYKFIWSEREAESNNEKLYYFYSFDFDDSAYYVWAAFLSPYWGKYKNFKAYWMWKASILLMLDKDFTIKKSYYVTSYFKKILPQYSGAGGFKIWKGKIYTYNAVFLNTKKVDKNYPVFSYIKFNKRGDVVNINNPQFIDSIYFIPNSFINFNNILHEWGNFKVFDGHLYACSGSGIWRLDGKIKNMLQIDTAYHIEKFDILSPTRFTYVYMPQNQRKTRDYYMVWHNNGDTMTKHIRYDTERFKVRDISVYKNHFYFLVEDTNCFYIDHHELDI